MDIGLGGLLMSACVLQVGCHWCCICSGWGLASVQTLSQLVGFHILKVVYVAAALRYSPIVG
jgi:hypothetical protein